MRFSYLPAVLVTLTAAAYLSSTQAYAQTVATGSQPAIGLSAGTLGIGGEVGVKVVGNFVVRLNGTWADLSYKKAGDGAEYSGRLKALSAGLTGDWHPFANGFRLSGGARYLNGEFQGKVSMGDVTIGNHTYTQAQYGALNLSIKNGNQIAPYIGLGYDSAHFNPGNWFFAFDIGAMYAGNAKVGLGVTGSAPGLAADLEIERQKLQDDFGKYGRFIPVVQLAAKYRF
jgi:hypothetical protein